MTSIWPEVSDEVWNRAAKEVAEEQSKALFDTLFETYPDLIVAPAVKLPPKERFTKYMMAIVEAYPNDPAARQRELWWLLNEDYIEAIKQGLVSPPMSRPWSLLWRIPRVFTEMQEDLRRTYRTHAGKEAEA